LPDADVLEQPCRILLAFAVISRNQVPDAIRLSLVRRAVIAPALR
jgi:hypothetical protein